jgi:hypothetical protein
MTVIVEAPLCPATVAALKRSVPARGPQIVRGFFDVTKGRRVPPSQTFIAGADRVACFRDSLTAVIAAPHVPLERI